MYFTNPFFFHIRGAKYVTRLKKVPYELKNEKTYPKCKHQRCQVNYILERGFSLIQMFQFQSIWGQMPTINPIFFHIKGVK